MKWRHAGFIVIVCLVLAQSHCVLAQEKAAKTSHSAVESQLKEVMLDNIKSTEAEDIEGTMKTVHSKSPLYQATRKQLSQLFGKHLGMKYELVSLKYLATDGDYAFARVHQRTTKEPATNFKNNETDILVAFRKESGGWKFWNQVVLDIQFLKP